MNIGTRQQAIALAVTPFALVTLTAFGAQSPQSQSLKAFKETVGPLIAKRCAPCHDAATRSGGLDLTSDTTARKGGDHQAALVAGRPEASLIFKRVAARQMPPTMPLTASEIETIRQWIAGGAAWYQAPASEKASEPKRAGPDWWSLLPPRLPIVPVVKDRAWVRNPIDAFVLSDLERHGLHPAPPASREVLIRRATYDLLGVPPTPDEISNFLNDRSSDAYEKLVDRLLSNPRYGERWGRHWLDVARFAESQGFERDAIRDHAWPYRDYVVRSFNSDKPYDQFVREQIAGDVLPNATADSIAATGFLVAGPYDEAGNSAASAVLRAQIREEELEDLLGTVGQTFLGLTVNCARCHDHKFDPILQRDYYRMRCVFDGVHGGDRPMVPTSDVAAFAAARERITARLNEVSDQIVLLEKGARSKFELWNVPGVPLPLARWSFMTDARDDLGSLDGILHGGAMVVGGHLRLNGKDAYVETRPLAHDIRAKTLEAWVSIPDREQRGGGVISIHTPDMQEFDAIVYGEREPQKWIAGSSAFQRTKDLIAPVESAPAEAVVHIAIVYAADSSITVYRNGEPYAASYMPEGPNSTLRTFLSGKSRILFGLRHYGAANGFLNGEIVEARLYDRALTAAQVRASHLAGPHKSPPLAARALAVDDRAKLQSLTAERDRLQTQLATDTMLPVVYAALPVQPAPTYLLLRGDVNAHGDLMSAGGLSALAGADFGLPASAPEGERRLKFADWLVRPDNPLTARVMVNRVWHYHFGRGIVASPNDFGYNGEKPTNQALLDWLACRFTDEGKGKREEGRAIELVTSSPYHLINPSSPSAIAWRLKLLHRLIMLSNTYRQSSRYDQKAAAKDAEDRMLWRFAPRRLEGEAVRDAMLAVSGRINWSMGGPGFRPFVETVNNSHFYSVFDKDGPEYNRRTIYRINVNSAKSTFLETLDCPDPSTKTPRRNVTTTPLQALELMNNRFVLEQCRFFGKRVAMDAGPDAENQATRAYLLALGRPPSPSELKRAAALVRSSGPETLCWALLNSSEFLTMR
jgi:mono/diheme cytochrome c family protein